ncbi:hypothetical protein EVAR_48052_1 [Eumeta japonica]|uniref:Reverse transcriptase domain-containing protein n=1 Tax=Eumeta variegata TaxID=151549 RepID=A0A4C1XKB6_EUMVA|nr:hypothetical protein EVAR_48052_1 [Eumeta japonica]
MITTFTSYLLKLLDEEIEAVGNYQATFMMYRSTDDHIFVVGRILDEKWKTGDSTTVITNRMKNLKELLISVGLKLNETKTKMLVRDPINKSIAKKTQDINGILITPVDTIKYLDSLRQDLSYHNRNQEESATLAQNRNENAADELYQLPETDTESSASNEENKE